MNEPRRWARGPDIDPAKGTVVRQPPGEGVGNWVGAPGVFFDTAESSFYLVYRIRRPRGVEPDRGGEIRIARSSNGISFDDIWGGAKDQLNSPSIERCALTHADDGRWRLYVSYVDPADDRWRIDLVEADGPDRFDLGQAKAMLLPGDIDVEGVKDPFLFNVAGLQHMIVSYAVSEKQTDAKELHGTADAYNTGLIKSMTGLAVSQDGKNWRWQGPILEPAAGQWDSYCARIGCVWFQSPVWLALYAARRM